MFSPLSHGLEQRVVLVRFASVAEGATRVARIHVLWILARVLVRNWYVLCKEWRESFAGKRDKAGYSLVYLRSMFGRKRILLWRDHLQNDSDVTEKYADGTAWWIFGMHDDRVLSAGTAIFPVHHQR
jgi:hypothetical protein